MCHALRRPSNRYKQEPNQTTKQDGNRRWEKQQSTLQKPRIPPARIPEITMCSHSGITSHLCTTRQTPTTPGRNVVVKIGGVKQAVKKWAKQLRHSGRTQSPLSSSFPSIIPFSAHSADIGLSTHEIEALTSECMRQRNEAAWHPALPHDFQTVQIGIVSMWLSHYTGDPSSFSYCHTIGPDG